MSFLQSISVLSSVNNRPLPARLLCTRLRDAIVKVANIKYDSPYCMTHCIYSLYCITIYISLVPDKNGKCSCFTDIIYHLYEMCFYGCSLFLLPDTIRCDTTQYDTIRSEFVVSTVRVHLSLPCISWWALSEFTFPYRAFRGEHCQSSPFLTVHYLTWAWLVGWLARRYHLHCVCM